MGRRLAPAPRAEIRDRSGAEPAQPTRGRGGAAGRDGPRETRAGARTGGTGLRGVPRRCAVPTTLFAPSASPPSRPTCSRRSSPTTGGGARRRPAERSARPDGRPRVAAAAAAETAVRPCAPTPSRSPSFAPTPRWPRPSVWPTPLPLARQRAASCAAPQARDGDRARAKPAGTKLVALSYARAALAALDLAQDLSRRAARLMDAAPKLRAKGKTGAIDGAARRRRRLRRGAHRGSERSRPAAAVRATGRSRRGARAHAAARPSASTGSDRMARKASLGTRLRPRARRPAAGIALARMEGPRRGGAVRRAEASDPRGPGAGGRQATASSTC